MRFGQHIHELPVNSIENVVPDDLFAFDGERYPRDLLKIREFAGTMVLDAEHGITIDAQRRVSAWSDRKGLIANFTQATNANKPLLSRSDNRENIFLNSGDLGNASWIKDNVTVPSAGTVSGFNVFKITETATTTSHILFTSSIAGAASGMTAKIFIRVKPAGRNFIRISRAGGAVGVTFELTGAGAKLEATATGNITLQSDGYYLCQVNMPIVGTHNIYIELKTALTTGAESYAGNITNGVLCYEPQFQVSAGADNTPLTTTDHPQYAGVNGRPALVFNGTQMMSTTTALSSIYSATASTLYIGVVPFSLAALANITGETSNIRHCAYANVNSFRFYDNDGTNKFTTSPVASANNLYIFRGRKLSGELICGIDSGAGFADGTPTGSVGDTTNMTNTMRIGSTVSGLYGKILAIATANVGTPDAAFEQRLRSYYL